MTRKSEVYRELLLQALGLFEGVRDPIANAANLSALLWQGLPDLNWAGFYFLKTDVLMLGPFQGKPACVRITLGKGVCGTAAASGQTLVVPNVHEFPGHIVCDGASNSEVVVPLLRAGCVIGVLDLDSPLVGRFDEDDASGLRTLAEAWVASSNSQ
jgi:L-methionine (R)-S-oxide reductase